MDAKAREDFSEAAVDTPAGSLQPWMFRFTLSPLNRRRWENFKVNRRGYWSLWVFLALFLISLFAEFIANDKPIYIHVNGHSFFPAVVTYPDTAFAKDNDPNLFGTAADYRDDYLMGLIKKEGGTVIWPLIRFSYNTQVSKPPSPFPSKPTWMLTQKDCDFAATHGFAKCGELEYNWLGTDDGGRDVLARLIYGFRISVLFGLALTIVSSIVGVAAGAVQGYFGGWTDLAVPALHRNLDLDPLALSAADHFLGAGAGLLRAARHPAAVLLGVAGRPGARGIPARTQFRIHPGRARARRVERRDHLPPSAAERHGGDHDVPAVHSVVVGDDADGARLPRLRPAARLALARRIAQPRQGQRAGALARPHRLLLHRHHAVAA